MDQRLIAVDDARRWARRRIPRFAFDYIDGAAGAERGMALNREAFDAVRLTPRVLAGNLQRSAQVQLLGRDYALPFGVAPIGLNNLAWPKADLGIAAAAAEANIPFILSTAGTLSIERAAETAGQALWFQLYVGTDPEITEDLIARARAAGVKTLVVTVDLPAPGKRVRDLRNGFKLPFKIGPVLAWDLISHPLWSLATLFGGQPTFASLERYNKAGKGGQSLAQLMARQSSARLDWNELARIRQIWDGPLVVKGVLHPEDARRLFASGVDGLIVSNHGGRQLDAAVAPLAALPAIRRAVGPDACVMLDGGIRGGEDIVRALALGADFVFLGRPFPMAAAAAGPRRGPARMIALLADEFDRAMAICGASTVAELRSSDIVVG